MNYADAYDSGYAARVQGVLRPGCPYRRPCWREAWRAGWDVADHRDNLDRAGMVAAFGRIDRDLLNDCGNPERTEDAGS